MGTIRTLESHLIKKISCVSVTSENPNRKEKEWQKYSGDESPKRKKLCTPYKVGIGYKIDITV